MKPIRVPMDQPPLALGGKPRRGFGELLQSRLQSLPRPFPAFRHHLGFDLGQRRFGFSCVFMVPLLVWGCRSFHP